MVVVRVQRPDWLLSGTLFMENSAAKCITVCLNTSQGRKSGHMVVVTHDRGLVQRPDWLLSGTLFMDNNAAKCIAV